MEFNPAGTGIDGASYAVAAGIYKNLGYLPRATTASTTTRTALIDEYASEGVTRHATRSSRHGPVTHLANHTHITARSEMLYAILVEGRGPLGSVFNRDDFTDQEVQDTDQRRPARVRRRLGATRSSSSAGRCCTTPTSSAAR